MKNDHPAGQPAFGSKLPKTQAPERRPSFATTKIATTIASKPTIVKKIANVYARE
jgi:hypothetical protein